MTESHCSKLKIEIRSNENSRTHWAIKDVDLEAVLKQFGLWNVIYAGEVQVETKKVGAKVLRGANKVTVQAPEAPEIVQQLREIAQAVPQPTGERSKVFVVHGRDDGRKNEVARWLAKVGMEDIVLHEHPNLGRNILTKFRDLAKDTSFAVVVATPDDVGGLVGGSQCARARQNVILELGFFIGVLGPERVALLRCDPGLEIPSDYSGILMIDYDARGAWKVEFAREFRALGIRFDASALI